MYKETQSGHTINESTTGGMYDEQCESEYSMHGISMQISCPRAKLLHLERHHGWYTRNRSNPKTVYRLRVL